MSTILSATAQTQIQNPSCVDSWLGKPETPFSHVHPILQDKSTDKLRALTRIVIGNMLQNQLSVIVCSLTYPAYRVASSSQ
jgi:hypothetical protein